MSDDVELEVMTSITGAMKTEMTDEQRELVVDWFGKKYGSGRAAFAAAAPGASAPVTATGGKTKATKKRRSGTPTPSGGAAPSNKPKGPVAHDKDLNLHPSGK